MLVTVHFQEAQIGESLCARIICAKCVARIRRAGARDWGRLWTQIERRYRTDVNKPLRPGFQKGTGNRFGAAHHRVANRLPSCTALAMGKVDHVSRASHRGRHIVPATDVAAAHRHSFA